MAQGQPPGLSEDERGLLTLLAAGLTDDAAAQRLQWSRRTVERRLFSAMEKLGARSRLDLGYQIGRVRLLDDVEVESVRKGQPD
jgi:DNA-binding NarL/FixJ family response regulator